MNKDSTRFRKKRRDAAAEQLLAAAETVIARVGYDEVTMAEIARAAGCATGTLYTYFRDKQQFVTALVERHGRVFRGRLQASMEGTADPLEKIRRATRTFLEYFAENRNYFKVLLGSNLIRRGVIPGALPKSELEERQRIQAGFLEIVRQAQREGKLRQDFTAEEIQASMRAFMMGTLDQLSLLETLPPTDEILRAYWAFLTGGIGGGEKIP